jgi:hypothetical protein
MSPEAASKMLKIINGKDNPYTTTVTNTKTFEFNESALGKKKRTSDAFRNDD